MSDQDDTIIITLNDGAHDVVVRWDETATVDGVEMTKAEFMQWVEDTGSAQGWSLLYSEDEGKPMGVLLPMADFDPAEGEV